jgi:hypothetical protein
MPGVDAGQRCDLPSRVAGRGARNRRPERRRSRVVSSARPEPAEAKDWRRQRLFGLRQLLSNLAEQRHLLS